MPGFLALRICVRKCPDEMYQIPDVLVRFHPSECGHAAQADTVLHDPKELAVRIPLYAGRSQIRCSGIHPSPCIGRFSSALAVALRTFRAEQFVSLLDARLKVGR